MAMTSTQIKQLIQDGHIERAKQELRRIDHPQAKKWLDQLESRYPDEVSEKPKRVMTVDEKLAEARSLIKSKEYDEARALLKSLGDHPTALRYLEKIDDLELSVSSSPVIINQSRQGPGCVVQVLWFLFVGWWAGQLWIVLSWLAMATVIGIPLGIVMINRVSQVIALRPPRQGTITSITVQDGQTTVTKAQNSVAQLPFIARAFWFLFLGWWLTGLWMQFAYFCCATLIGMPLGFWMFDRTPSVLTLRRG